MYLNGDGPYLLKITVSAKHKSYGLRAKDPTDKIIKGLQPHRYGDPVDDIEIDY